MWLGRDGVEQRLGDPRLADPGLADQQHTLTLAGLGQGPAFEQQRQLLVAALHRQDRPGAARREAALQGLLAGDHEGRNRFGQALEHLRLEGLELEQIAQELPCRFADHQLARLGQRLQPGREIGRVADHGLLTGGALADQLADHDEPGRDADPAGERLARTCGQIGDGVAHREPGPDRPLRLVLVRYRPTEIGQDAVAHELRHMALEPGDLAGHGVLVGAQDVAHLLGIQLRRERGRADEIDEHHSQLAALRLAGGRASLGDVAGGGAPSAGAA